MRPLVQNWRIMDKIKKIRPYTSSDKISNVTLKCELDLTIFSHIGSFASISAKYCSYSNCSDSSY